MTLRVKLVAPSAFFWTTGAQPARDEQLRRFPSPFWRLLDFSAAALGWKIESFQTASENGFPKPLARARRQASPAISNRMRLGFCRSSERARIKWANTRRRSVEQASVARHDFLSSGPANALRTASSRICGGVSVIPQIHLLAAQLRHPGGSFSASFWTGRMGKSNN